MGLLSYGLPLLPPQQWMDAPDCCCCNSLLFGLAKSNPVPLTSIQNTTAKVISLSTRSSPTTAVCPPAHHAGLASSLPTKHRSHGEVLPPPLTGPSPIFQPRAHLPTQGSQPLSATHTSHRLLKDPCFPSNYFLKTYIVLMLIKKKKSRLHAAMT